MLNRAEFLKSLRNDLNHLYDPIYLGRSPNLALFGLASEPDPPTALQHLLTKAIGALKPVEGSPYSRAWEIYEILLYRYVEQLTPQEVADQLAFSVRHLRRKQQVALTALADWLWKEYRLAEKLPEEESAETFQERAVADRTPVEKELAWLIDASHDSVTDLGESLPAVIQLTERLAAQHDVQVETILPEHLPSLEIHPVAFRQILLNLLSTIIPRASGGKIGVTVKPLQREVQIRVHCQKTGTFLRLANADASVLKMAQQLAELSKCRLAHAVEGGAFHATLTVAARQQVRVLVIDDNPDTLRMLKRYTFNSRYHLITTQDPERALSLAEKFAPQIIILDVMMPQLDGWQLLQQLRQDPATADTRIIVCSILGQSDFAFFMGADGLITKPVTPQSFLAALDQQVDLMGKGSR